MAPRCRRTGRQAPPARSAAAHAPLRASFGSAWQRRQSESRSRVDLFDIGKAPTMDQTEDRVGDQSEDADGENGRNNAIHAEKPLGDEDEAADAAFGPQEFGDDQVRPGP